MLDYWAQNLQKSFDDTRRNESAGRVVAMLLTYTACPTVGCGWDPITQSAILTGDPVCKGRGRIETWVRYNLRARVMWVEQAKMDFFVPTPGIMMGQCVLTVGQKEIDVINAVIADQRAYIQVDNRKVKPSSVQQTVVSNMIFEWEVLCNVFTPPSM